MSSGLTLMVLPADISSIDELPPDYRPEPVGPLATVHEQLRAAFPAIDLSRPDVAEISAPTWVIEVRIGREDPVDAIGLRVVGDADEAEEAVHRIARAVGCQVFCNSMGDLLVEGRNRLV